MTDEKSILTELVERRLPQILGVYVASVWLAVEVSEWLSERFDVPDQTSSYVFVIMISFLPLVGLLAWGHGRPGKDKWTQKQLIFIPFNIAIAWFAVNAFIKPEVQATEVMSLADVQTGELVEYEVAKSGLSQKVIGFFWENTTGDESLDWLSYGAMWLVSKDLMRNPIISIQTPYDSGSLNRAITSKGFERALGEPLSLDLDISGDRDAQWMIRGQITRAVDKLTFEASLYDVLTGALVTTITSSYDDWLFAIDDVAEQLGKIILEKANIAPSIIPDRPLAEHISGNLLAIEAVIGSLNAVTFDNDFAEGITLLKTALSDDKQLAEAYVLMINYYRGLGDFAQAKTAAEAALRLEYKLSQEMVLMVKANYYGISGDSEKAIKVLENWVKLYPESADALQALGANYIVVGNRLDDALKVFRKLNDLQESSSTALVNQARIYRLKGNQQQALAALKMYQENDPEKIEPLLEMGAANLQFGDLEAAKSNFEEASLMSINNISADVGLAKIMALQGDIDGGLKAFDQLLEKSATDPERVQVLTEKEIVLYSTGRILEALELVDQTKAFSQSYLPPLAQNLIYGPKEVGYLAYLQEYDSAWQILAALKQRTKPPFDQILLMIDIIIYELMGDDEKVSSTLDLFEQFIKENQMDAYNQFVIDSRAKLSRNAGDFTRAIELHDRAITDSKQSFLILNSLMILDDLIYSKAITMFEMQQFDDVLTIIAEVLQRNPLNGQAKLLRARALIELGQLEAAQLEIEAVKEFWAKADKQYIHFKELVEIEEKLVAVDS